eukprot:gnl/MRDRNA2_/MRDRNA2_81675_c0_seq1.p1 gnl/MRDRNA2_/MRDRNA2_81675_c0~~gnl/MRDRNA2_/MRDRNA2_81675_c0_seq1.p1  ORF type:complete len:240 (+),score=45.15 gnl/MRDRNA2_/MRDRNA2_81675_c0_seq1:180-899(+)
MLTFRNAPGDEISIDISANSDVAYTRDVISGSFKVTTKQVQLVLSGVLLRDEDSLPAEGCVTVLLMPISWVWCTPCGEQRNSAQTRGLNIDALDLFPQWFGEYEMAFLGAAHALDPSFPMSAEALLTFLQSLESPGPVGICYDEECDGDDEYTKKESETPWLLDTDLNLTEVKDIWQHLQHHNASSNYNGQTWIAVQSMHSLLGVAIDQEDGRVQELVSNASFILPDLIIRDCFPTMTS